MLFEWYQWFDLLFLVLKNALSPIDFTVDGIEMDFNDGQCAKTKFPILVTPNGIVTDCNELQFENV